MPSTLCPSCHAPAAINRHNKDGSTYYYCKACGKYFTIAAQDQDEEKEPEISKQEHVSQEETHQSYRLLDSEPFEGPIDHTIKKNTAELSGMFSIEDIGGIPTKERMVKWFAIDETVWEVVKWVPKVWHMGYKDKDGHGKRLPLFGATMYIERRKRIEIDIPGPTIVTIATPQARQITTPKKYSTVQRALFLSDYHIGFRRDMKTGKLRPYHDRQAFEAMITIAEQQCVDTIILGGDMIDLPEMTDKFPRDPNVFFTIRPALVELKWVLTYLRKVFPSTRIVYLEGNHEVRIRKFTIKHMIAAYDIADPETDHRILGLSEMLHLSDIDVEWIGGYPDNAIWLNSNIRCIHGDKIKSETGQTANAYLKVPDGVSTIFGHIHRCELAKQTVHLPGRVLDRLAVSPGMMAIPENVPANKNTHNWQEGFAIIDYEDHDGGLFAVELVHIYQGSTLYHGRVINGIDYTNRLRRDTGWEVFLPEKRK